MFNNLCNQLDTAEHTRTQNIQPSESWVLKLQLPSFTKRIFSLKREMSGGGNGASPGLDHLQLGKLPTFNISELMADNVRAVALEGALAGKQPGATLTTSWSDSRIPRPAAISGM